MCYSLVDKSRQKEVLARMLKIEVKLATAVIMKKYVMVHDKRIYAADEDGLAALEDDGPQLEILINSKRARSGQLALHKISDALSDALGISKALRSLTKDILITDDTELIESELEHAGLGVSSIESNESTKSLPPMLDMTKQLRKSAAAQQWQPGKTVIGSNTKYSINASKWAAKAGTAYSGYGSTPGGMSSNGGALHATSPDMGYDGYASTQSHPSNGRRSRHTTSMRNGGPSDFDGKAGDYDYQDLDMSSVRAIIDKAVNTENDNMAAIQRREALAEDGASATVHELTIGRAGEAFVSLNVALPGITRDC